MRERGGGQENGEGKGVREKEREGGEKRGIDIEIEKESVLTRCRRVGWKAVHKRCLKEISLLAQHLSAHINFTHTHAHNAVTQELLFQQNTHNLAHHTEKVCVSEQREGGKRRECECV